MHHTVNANGYSRDDVPSILRGIYAYHTQSRGWSDVGYNFLVDRFGRIWEGRYGGVDRPVVGAHTLGYNDDAFAMSAIGNYETAQPSQAMLDAYARLFAWKLSLCGVRADDTRQYVTSRYFQAINGHRDAGQTACPGRVPLRQDPRHPPGGGRPAEAVRRPQPAGRTCPGGSWPDLVVRDAQTQHAMIVRTGGQTAYLKGSTAATGLGRVDLLAAPGDVDEDGTADVIARGQRRRRPPLPRAPATAGCSATDRSYARFSGLDLLTGVGDFDGDGHVDLVGPRRLHRRPRCSTRATATARSAPVASSRRGSAATTSSPGSTTSTATATPTWWRGPASTLYLLPGHGQGPAQPGGAARRLERRSTSITGRGDASGDGRPDLVARVRRHADDLDLPGRRRRRPGSRGIGPFDPVRTACRGSRSPASWSTARRPTSPASDPATARLRVFANSGRRNLGKVVDTGTSLRGVDLLLNVGDWNGDGRGDVMTRDASTGVLSVPRRARAADVSRPRSRSRTGWSSVSLRRARRAT